MVAKDDTITAVITPPGEGGIGGIRISGPNTSKIIARIFTPASAEKPLHHYFHLYYGHIIDKNKDIIDEVTMVEMPAGKSYTGQDQAEIFCHGGQYILKRIVELILSYGARPAEPGEFTKRAFLAGRIDLARAEAVADMIAAKTEYSYNNAKAQLLGNLSTYLETIRKSAIRILAEVEASVDYPEEDIEAGASWVSEDLDNLVNDVAELAASYKSGRIIKDGFRIAIAGRPNAGKSSLFNLMLNQNRAIVSPTAGTTRDYLTEWIDLDGIATSITDTAGLRVGQKIGKIEKAGQDSAKDILKESDLIIWIIDISKKVWRTEAEKDIAQYAQFGNILILFNKIDKIRDMSKVKNTISDRIALNVSCETKAGYKALQKELIRRISDNMPDMTDRLVVTSARHERKLKKSLAALKRARKLLGINETPELIAFELRAAVNEIDELTGKIYNEDILEDIFSRFCIGK